MLNCIVECRPELHMDFNDGQIIDKSGNHLPIYVENVIPYRGAAYFNGQARLLINRFSNTAFHGHLVIKFRYKEDLRGASANALQALITNGDCGEDPSIIVAKMMGYVLLASKTGTTRTFAMPVVVSDSGFFTRYASVYQRIHSVATRLGLLF